MWKAIPNVLHKIIHLKLKELYKLEMITVPTVLG